MELCIPLQGVLNEVFPKCSTKEEICYNVRNEQREFQTYLTRQLFSFKLKKIPANGCKQVSYWEKTFELAGIPSSNNGDYASDDCFDFDTLIISLKEKIVTESGSVEYPLFLSLFKTVVSLSYRNSAPETGFSIKNSSLGFIGTPYKLIQLKH